MEKAGKSVPPISTTRCFVFEQKRSSCCVLLILKSAAIYSAVCGKYSQVFGTELHKMLHTFLCTKIDKHVLYIYTCIVVYRLMLYTCVYCLLASVNDYGGTLLYIHVCTVYWLQLMIMGAHSYMYLRYASTYISPYASYYCVFGMLHYSLFPILVIRNH